MTCNAYHDLMAEYVAEGEPSTWRYALLRRHLSQCASCRAQVDRLRHVEQALWAWPLEMVSAPLHERLVATLDGRETGERWPLVPWNVWLPLLTLLAAASLVFLLVPPGERASLGSLFAGNGVRLVEGMIDNHVLTAVWMGVCVALAGIGLTTALTLGRLPNHDEIGSFRDRASAAAEHLWRLAGHSR
jgi:hypothetical protein